MRFWIALIVLLCISLRAVSEEFQVHSSTCLSIEEFKRLRTLNPAPLGPDNIDALAQKDHSDCIGNLRWIYDKQTIDMRFKKLEDENKQLVDAVENLINELNKRDKSATPKTP